MRLVELCTLFRGHARVHCVKHGRPTSSRYVIDAALERLLGCTIEQDKLEDRPTTRTLLDGRKVRAIEDLDAEAFTAADLSDFLEQLGNTTHRLGRPYTLRTLTAYRQAVLSMYQWAGVDRTFVPKTMKHDLSRARVPRPGKTRARRKRRVTSAAQEVIFGLAAFCERHASTLPAGSARDRLRRRRWWLLGVALELMWELGCRPGELAIMRPIDVVTDDDGAVWYLPSEWKTEHNDGDERRRMLMTSRAQELLERAIVLNRQDGDQHLMSFAVEWSDEDRLFPWKSGNANHARSGLAHAIRDALKLAGLPHTTANQIRHAFITRAAAVNLLGASAQAGHKNLKTTQGYIDQRKDEICQLFNQLAGSGGPARPTPPPTDAPRLRLVGA